MYRIYTKQIDKKSGKCVGLGMSVKTYANRTNAIKQLPNYVIENSDFRQIAAVAQEMPFTEN